MVDQCGQETLECRSHFVETAMKDKLQFAIKNDWIAELFCDIDRNTREELSLCSKQSTHLPAEFGVYMKNLIWLDVSNDKVMNLPYTLEFIAEPESLLLDRNCIRNLPLVVTNLSCLTVLHLSSNCIKMLPAKLGDIVSLETLILSSNRLFDLPESLKKLNRLKTLDLSYNCFKRFPFCVLKGMRSLESLNVSHNKYINITTAPASEKLKKFYVREVGARIKFPLWLFGGCARALEVLDLEGTKFKYFNVPDNCPRLNIKSLSLQRCSFYDLFINELTRCTDQLECLKIGNGSCRERGNAFRAMPIESLKHPELLTEIDLRATGLPVVCQTIRHFVNLIRLDLGNNNISWLCNEICSLKKLKVLLIDENGLDALPDNIGRMTALKELKANDNNLARLPESIRDLKNLTYLDLYDNEFKEIPTDLQYMDNLLGLDLDRNDFTINDSDFIRDTPYEIVKKAVRNRYWNRDHCRLTGPRYERDTGEQSEASSDISSITCHEWKTNVDENANSIEHAEEDWDNSADEFEPGREASQSSIGQWSWVERTMAMGIYATRFCPADLHIPPVRQRVKQMRAKGETSCEFAIEEGQFEDA